VREVESSKVCCEPILPKNRAGIGLAIAGPRCLASIAPNLLLHQRASPIARKCALAALLSYCLILKFFKCSLLVSEVPHSREDHRQSMSIRASTTSWSRTEPPGWMIAVRRLSAISSTPSGNGKNASEAATDLAREATLSWLPLCMHPLGSFDRADANVVRHAGVYRIAFDLTCLHTFQANSKPVFLCRGFPLGQPPADQLP